MFNSTKPFITETMIILSVLKIFLAFSIVLGNGLIIMAFVVDKNLRLRNNFFFLNLAIADFFVGAICIPLYIPYEMQSKWIFGRELCLFWLVIDYLLCTASVYNIVLISYDRYQLVCNAISYRIKQTSISRTVTYMGAAWILAFLVHGPAILNGRKEEDDTECRHQLIFSAYYIIITSILEFLIPTILVTYFNCCIYWNLQRRSSRVKNNSIPFPNTPSPVQGDSMTCTFISKMCLPKLDEELPSSMKKMRKKSFFASLKTLGEDEMTSAELSSVSHSNSVSADFTAQHHKFLRDRKVAKSLAIILGAFVFCWAPYILFTIIRSISQDDVDDPWYTFTFWLQWFNSFLNPFLYPLCHKRFRNAFMKIFCKKKLTASLRSSLSS
ncbi:histamine H4 receptor [Sminthopsis crassicaudata]|uniref:histamine H4 receptor n=1 Tax=Sminthopsis crassicaudata TaxID=9301 RepID=UPI003D69007D